MSTTWEQKVSYDLHRRNYLPSRLQQSAALQEGLPLSEEKVFCPDLQPVCLHMTLLPSVFHTHYDKEDESQQVDCRHLCDVYYKAWYRFRRR